jgi:hypothetical protein
MNEAARSLIAHHRRLLAVIRSGSQDDALPELMQIRTERLRALGASLAAGEPVPPVDVRELECLEREISDALHSRRDAVAQELAALYRRRRAERAYQAEGGRTPRYMDRAG